MKQKPKELDLELELFNILNDYGDFFLTDYPKQAETKSIHPTIERIMKLLTQQRTELLEKNKNGCYCKYDSKGKRIGLCLRCAKLRLEAFNKGRRELLEEIKKEKRYDPWAYGFNMDMTSGYNQAIDDIINLLNKKDE